MSVALRTLFFAFNFLYILAAIIVLVVSYITFLDTNPFQYDASLVDRSLLSGLVIVGMLNLISAISACFSAYRPTKPSLTFYLISVAIVAIAALVVGFLFVADADPSRVYDGSLWFSASDSAQDAWERRHNCCGFSADLNNSIPESVVSAGTITNDPRLENLTLSGATDPSCPAVLSIIYTYLNFTETHPNQPLPHTEAYVATNCRDAIAIDRGAVLSGYAILMFSHAALDAVCFALGVLMFRKGTDVLKLKRTSIRTREGAVGPGTRSKGKRRRHSPEDLERGRTRNRGERVRGSSSGTALDDHEASHVPSDEVGISTWDPFAPVRDKTKRGSSRLFANDEEPAWLVALRSEHEAAEAVLRSASNVEASEEGQNENGKSSEDVGKDSAAERFSEGKGPKHSKDEATNDKVNGTWVITRITDRSTEADISEGDTPSSWIQWKARLPERLSTASAPPLSSSKGTFLPFRPTSFVFSRTRQGNTASTPKTSGPVELPVLSFPSRPLSEEILGLEVGRKGIVLIDGDKHT
ncbi:hypothetical protein BJ742DRAFT_742167 [Cladochytrium replicatum]|nr:hypothetical protein BJ742DRAFT_742167 [Cladochytrium replicatum]